MFDIINIIQYFPEKISKQFFIILLEGGFIVLITI